MKEGRLMGSMLYRWKWIAVELMVLQKAFSLSRT